MADPVTLAILISGSLKAASQIQEGRIAKAQGSFANKIALRNQEALERQAKAERAASRVEEARISRRAKIVKGRQRARIGKQATGLAGATLAALVDTAVQFSIERNLALRTGLVKGRELKRRGVIIAAQGRWAKTLGVQAKRLSYIKATGSILGSVAVASQFGTAATTGTAGGSRTFAWSGFQAPTPRTTFRGL